MLSSSGWFTNWLTLFAGRILWRLETQDQSLLKWHFALFQGAKLAI